MMTLEFRSANLCWKIANNSLGLGLQAHNQWEKNQYYVTGVVFVAFAFEAMLNHYSSVFRISEKATSKNGKEYFKSRKDLHGEVFKSANLPCFLGSDSYSKIARCMELRDSIAHGKTQKDLKINAPFDGVSVSEAMHAPSPFEHECITSLESFIQVVLEIESTIEKNGRYPEGHPNFGEQLLECPLNVSGVRTWKK